MNLIPIRARVLGLAVLLAGASALPVAAAGNTRDAERLLAEMRRDLAPIENQIRNHPYLTALENGQVPISNLRAFAGEQYNIIASDLRSAAQLTARYGAAPSGAFFNGIIGSEVIARDYIIRFAAALGWTEEDLKAYEPNPRAQTYPSYVTWMSVHASDGQVAAAYAVNFAVFGENLGRMGAHCVASTASRPSIRPISTSSPSCRRTSSPPPCPSSRPTSTAAPTCGRSSARRASSRPMRWISGTRSRRTERPLPGGGAA